MTLLERIDAALEHAKSSGRASSAREVASLAGLSPGYFGKTRIDLKKNPTADLGANTIAKIAAACGVRSEWLSAEAGPMLEPKGSQYAATMKPAAEPLTIAEPTAIYGDPLERALTGGGVWWKPGMTPEQMDRVVRNAKAARGKTTESLPERYWFQYLEQLSQQELKGEKVSQVAVEDAGTDRAIDEFAPRPKRPKKK